MSLRQFAAALCGVLLLVTSPAWAEFNNEINFGIISTDSSTNLKSEWAPILADFEKKTGLKIKPFFASDYAGIVEGMRFNKVQVAYFGNQSAMEAVDRADGEIFAQAIQANGNPGYYSVLIVHKDSPIQTLDDVLKAPGKYNFANGDPNSTSGYLMPAYYVFAQNKIDPKTHFKRMVSGSHETNIMAVLNKQVDLATNNTNDMTRVGQHLGERIKDIRVIWTSPIIPADPLVWRKDLPEAVKAKVSGFFYGYGKEGTPEDMARERKNLEVLAFAGYRKSNNDQSLPIRQLKLFKDHTLIEQDANIPPAEKASRLADIDAQLDALKKRAAAVGAQ